MSYEVPCFNGCGKKIEVIPGAFRTTPAAVVMVDGRAESVLFCSEKCIAEFSTRSSAESFAEAERERSEG